MVSPRWENLVGKEFITRQTVASKFRILDWLLNQQDDSGNPAPQNLKRAQVVLTDLESLMATCEVCAKLTDPNIKAKTFDLWLNWQLKAINDLDKYTACYQATNPSYSSPSTIKQTALDNHIRIIGQKQKRIEEAMELLEADILAEDGAQQQTLGKSGMALCKDRF